MLRARTLLITAAAVTLLGLSGCSAASDSSPKAANTTAETQAPATQSTAAACSVMAKSGNGAFADLQESMSTAATDPQGATAKLDGLAASLDSGLAEVTNEEVKAVFTTADNSLKAMIEQVKKVQVDPASLDAAAFQASIADVQTTFAALGEVCK